jgi:hypothetical protein
VRHAKVGDESSGEQDHIAFETTLRQLPSRTITRIIQLIFITTNEQQVATTVENNVNHHGTQTMPAQRAFARVVSQPNQPTGRALKAL